MGRRRPCSSNSKDGLNRGTWTAGEDEILVEYIRNHGEGRWERIPKRTGLKRCGKSCRLRWLNYLRPDIKRGNITDEEEDLIIRLHKLLGNRWSLIAGRLPGRTDNEIKNYWNTILKKKLERRSTSDKPKAASATSPPAVASSGAQELRAEEAPAEKLQKAGDAEDGHLDEEYWFDALQLCGGGGELEQLGGDSGRTVASFYKEVLGDWTDEGNPSGASYDCVDYFPSWAPFFSL